MTPAVKAYQDDIINGTLATVLAKSKEIGGLVEQHVRSGSLLCTDIKCKLTSWQTALLEPLCQAQLDYLRLASAHAKPTSASAIQPLLKPQSEAITKAMETKDTLNRSKEGREWGACLSVVGEGVGAWGWVSIVRSLSFRIPRDELGFSR